MATLPQSHEYDEEDFDIDLDGSGLPGHTVDALLDQGKVEEAKAELERLLLEGLNSGSPRQMDEALFDEIVAEARARVRARQAAR